MANKYQMTQAAELESLAVFREFVERACEEAGLDEQTCYDLKLSVDEACTNVVTHGYAGMNPGSIIVSLSVGPEMAVVRITDFGHPFEPSEPDAPHVEAALEDRPTGGLGLYFIYQSMDEVDYETNEDGNTLILIKRLVVADANQE